MCAKKGVGEGQCPPPSPTHFYKLLIQNGGFSELYCLLFIVWGGKAIAIEYLLNHRVMAFTPNVCGVPCSDSCVH